MADNNIDLTASFDASNAIKGVNEFGRAANKAVDGVNESVNGLQKSITKTSGTKLDVNATSAISALDGLKGKILAVGAGLATYFTAQAIGGFFNKIIDEAVDAQNNLNQLNAALQRTGQLTPEVSASMAKFAADLTAVSTIDDDVINGQLAIALNFTKSAEKAQELVGAASNLSAAMKIDLGTAVELLGKTLDGTAGRLNETVPALRGVSEEALKSGAAIKIVNEAFAGAATAEINTYSGALAQLGNVFGNFAASLGNMIVQNPMVSQAIKEISKGFIDATSSIEGGTNASISFVNRGVVTIISGIRDLMPGISVLNNTFMALKISLETLFKSILNLVDALKILGNSWIWLVGTMSGKQSAMQGISDAFDRLIKRSDDLATTWDKMTKDGFKDIDTSGIDAALKRIQDAANKKPIDISTNIKGATLPKLDIKKIEIPNIEIPKAEQNKKAEKDNPFFPFENAEDLDFAKFIDPFRELGTLWQNRLPGMFDGFQAVTIALGEAIYVSWKVAKSIGNSLIEAAPAMLSGIQGLIAAMGEGAEGARKAIPDVLAKMTTGIGSAVGGIWGPLGSKIGEGLGGIVGEQIKLAAQPIGDTLKSIDEFMAEVPNVLKRITDNLPTIMNKVFENLPDLLISIFKALPAIMRASASAMKPLFKEIGKELPSILQTLLEVAWESIAMVFMAIGYAAQGLAIGLSEMIKEKLAAIRDKMTLGFDSIGTAWDTAVNWVKTKLSFFTVDKLMENIDTFMTGIIDIFTKAWADVEKFGTFLSDFFKNIGPALNAGFNKGIEELGENLKSFFKDFGKNIGAAITSKLNVSGGDDWLTGVGDAIKKGFGDLFSAEFYKSLGQAILDGFTKLFDKLNPFKSEENGGGGSTATAVLTGGISELLATGGVVPPGYPDDQYPALLTSNEVVVPAATTPNLFSLIDKLANGSAPNNQSNDETNQLLRQLIAIIVNQQTQVDVKIDRDTLARAILSLNKDNRRLA